MSKVKILGIDPALSNMGLAIAEYDLLTGQLEMKELRLIQTEGTKVKQVRKNSDDLERARQMHDGLQDAAKNCWMAVAEIPTGTQSARGAMSNGIALGVLASCPIPLIQVQPTEVKVSTVGVKTATKGEMIEWAMRKYPALNWLMRKSKGQMVPMNDNEHLADAVAIIETGLKTDQFKQAMALFEATMRTAENGRTI